ncbi:MAG: HNH endonuclease, partial [Rhodothermales bacterium]
VGEPFFFKLKARYGSKIAGFGTYVLNVNLPVSEAWAVFGESNGVRSELEMWSRVGHYVQKLRGTPPPPNHEIGCLLIASPIFFPKEMWLDPPTDWSPNIVSGKSYDLTTGEGLRLWKRCLERAEELSLSEPASYNLKVMEDRPRYGKETVVKPRLGQGSFRYVLQSVYKKCAVTREHSLPALDAAHIVPYSHGGMHEVPNGLLLRADIHKLFDRGFVTVTPDFRFRVSGLLDEQYQNGRAYYQLEGSEVWVPENEQDRPRKEYLEMHSSEIFLD